MGSRDPLVDQVSAVHDALAALLQALSDRPAGISLNDGDQQLLASLYGRLEVRAEQIDLLRRVGSLSPWQRFLVTPLLRGAYDQAVKDRAEWKILLTPEISWKGNTKERGAQWTASIGPLMDRMVAELHELLILAETLRGG